MSYNNIYTNTKNSITTITVNRLTKLNALNKETINELHEAFKLADLDKNTRVIIITGVGEKAFIAGADISEFSNFDDKQGEALAKKGQDILFNFIEQLSTPVIAAINGYALGGGLELAMACHFRVASVNAKMGLPEVSLGLIPGYGGTQRLPKLIGKGRALELIMTASMIDANTALNYGLVNYVKPLEELLPFCETIAVKISKNSTTAIAAAITAVNASYKNEINGFDIEINAFGKCFNTKDFKEGTTAFLEKRKPNFY